MRQIRGIIGSLITTAHASSYRYDMPLDQVPMVASHNSYNTEEEGVSIEWEVRSFEFSTI